MTADPNESCGVCYWCHSGQTTFCQDMAAYGVLRDGAFAENIVVTKRGAYPLPAGVGRRDRFLPLGGASTGIWIPESVPASR